MSRVCESTLDRAIGWLFASARRELKTELLLTQGSSCCWLLLFMGSYPVDLVMAVCLGGGLLRVVACYNGRDQCIGVVLGSSENVPCFMRLFNPVFFFRYGFRLFRIHSELLKWLTSSSR